MEMILIEPYDFFNQLKTAKFKKIILIQMGDCYGDKN